MSNKNDELGRALREVSKNLGISLSKAKIIIWGNKGGKYYEHVSGEGTQINYEGIVGDFKYMFKKLKHNPNVLEFIRSNNCETMTVLNELFSQIYRDNAKNSVPFVNGRALIKEFIDAFTSLNAVRISDGMAGLKSIGARKQKCKQFIRDVMLNLKSKDLKKYSEDAEKVRNLSDELKGYIQSWEEDKRGVEKK